MFPLARLRDAVAVLSGRAEAKPAAKPTAPPSPSSVALQANLAFLLRTGLGALFVVGGLAKLSRLLSPSAAEGIVTQYMGPLGYINETFQEWLFTGVLGAALSPWTFLTLLSAFELVSGVMLMVGLFVRSLAAFWTLLLWSFVVSLPVVTTPGVTPDAPTYTSPALFVQIRDVALSGFFVVLYNLGSGSKSVDVERLGAPLALGRNWDPLGLLLRLSLAIMFIVGGFFHGYAKIPTFSASAEILAVIGLGLAAGHGVRYFAIAAVVVVLWHMLGKIPDASGLLGFLNAIKREIAIVLAAGALALAGGGRLFTVGSMFEALTAGWARLRGAAVVDGPAPEPAASPTPAKAENAAA